MRYSVDDTVFCPPHGPCLVQAVQSRRVNGEDRAFLVLRPADHRDLVLSVPTDNLDRRGVAAMPRREELEQVLEILRAESVEFPTTPWAQQCRDNVEALASGDMPRVARVLRAVYLRGRAQPLTRSEKHMLVKARQALVTRLSLCLDGPVPAQVERLIDDALAGD